MKLHDIENALERSLLDVNRNYSQILEELSLSNFNDIIKEYDRKFQNYRNSIENIEKSNVNLVSVYVPAIQIMKIVKKATVGGLEESSISQMRNSSEKKRVKESPDLSA